MPPEYYQLSADKYHKQLHGATYINGFIQCDLREKGNKPTGVRMIFFLSKQYLNFLAQIMNVLFAFPMLKNKLHGNSLQSKALSFDHNNASYKNK